jgi:hypothetical protein
VHCHRVKGGVDGGDESGNFVNALLPQNVQAPGAVFSAAPGKQDFLLHFVFCTNKPYH